jgi:hypothetical protein
MGRRCMWTRLVGFGRMEGERHATSVGRGADRGVVRAGVLWWILSLVVFSSPIYIGFAGSLSYAILYVVRAIIRRRQ